MTNWVMAGARSQSLVLAIEDVCRRRNSSGTKSGRTDAKLLEVLRRCLVSGGVQGVVGVLSISQSLLRSNGNGRSLTLL